MIILKLGGSVITRKEEKQPTLHQENLARISQEIANSGVKDLLIVHGAGSYGHRHAYHYQIGAPILDGEDLARKRLGFSITHQGVQELNLEVCRALLDQKIPAVPLSPSSFIHTHHKRIEEFETDLIGQYLELGLVPVLYGDVVLDQDLKIKMAVLSGDQILQYLAQQLGAEQVILGTDVDGIYNRNPKTHPNAQLIPLVTSLDDVDFLEGAHTMDVTGGMGGKVKELLQLAEEEVESQIINLNVEGLLERALMGDKVPGTWIKKRPMKE
ncbi:MAG: isopentenyl phosphate kinase [Euryarchaeota archaeon]|jgi:isopentenyl phosphate kinase|nr:isopentenyl phosphate kinase [Euryarchaeota archaeon]